MTKMISAAHHLRASLLDGPSCFANRHPYLFTSLGFVAMPLALVSAVSLFTCIFVLPIGYLFQWI